MDDATICKYAKQIWWWVDDTTNVARVKAQDYSYSPIIYEVSDETDDSLQLRPQSQVPEYRRIPVKEAWFAKYTFQLDSPAVVLYLAFGREINTVFVREDAEA